MFDSFEGALVAIARTHSVARDRLTSRRIYGFDAHWRVAIETLDVANIKILDSGLFLATEL